MGLATLKIEDLPHYTYDDYVKWEGRWELIRGIPYAMVPAPTKKHQWLSAKIAAQLVHPLKNCGNCRTLMPVDWQITPDTVVQPDVLVVCEENIEGEKLETPPVLVFEILSPSSTRMDRIIKYQLYQEAGVKYYCIGDPESRSAEVFQLRGDEYQEMREDQEGKMTFHLGECSLTFDFAELFKE